MKKVLSALMALLMALLVAIPVAAAGTPTDTRDLSAYGQQHVTLSSMVATAPRAQGRIDSGEYTASRTITTQHALDTTAQNHLGEVSNWIEYYAYDQEYLYLAVSFHDPSFSMKVHGFLPDGSDYNYNDNPSLFTFVVSVPTTGDFIGSTERLEFPIEYYPDHHYDIDSLALCRRYTQVTYNEETGSMTSVQKDVAVSSNNMPLRNMVADIGGVYDEDTGNVTYELKLDIKAMMVALGETETEYFGVYTDYKRTRHYMNGNTHLYEALGTISTRVPVDTTVQDSIRNATGVKFVNGFVPHMVKLPVALKPFQQILDPDDPKASVLAVDARDYEIFGQKQTYLSGAIAQAPVKDGVIGSGEYSVSYDTTERLHLEGTGPLANSGVSGLVTYMAFDETYVYYAAEVTESQCAVWMVDGVGYEQSNQFEFMLGVANGGDLHDVHSFIRINTTPTADAANASYTQNGMFSDGTIPMCDKSTSYFRHTTGGKRTGNKTVYEGKIAIEHLKTYFEVDEIKGLTLWTRNMVYKDGSLLATVTDRVEIPTYVIDTINTYRSSCEALRFYDGDLGSYLPHMIYVNGIDFVDVDTSPITIQTKNAASVRFGHLDGHLGLRFTSSVDWTVMDRLVEKYGRDKITVGHLIAPKSYVDEAGSFTKEALEALGKAVPYRDVKTTTYFRMASGSYIFAGSLVDILEKNLEKEFAAIGYIQIEGMEPIYSDSYTVRSVSEVALRALEDTQKAQDADYCYLVAGTLDTYSPYTTEERKFLATLKVAKIEDLFYRGKDAYANDIRWE